MCRLVELSELFSELLVVVLPLLLLLELAWLTRPKEKLPRPKLLLFTLAMLLSDELFAVPELLVLLALAPLRLLFDMLEPLGAFA